MALEKESGCAEGSAGSGVGRRVFDNRYGWPKDARKRAELAVKRPGLSFPDLG